MAESGYPHWPLEEEGTVEFEGPLTWSGCAQKVGAAKRSFETGAEV